MQKRQLNRTGYHFVLMGIGLAGLSLLGLVTIAGDWNSDSDDLGMGASPSTLSARGNTAPQFVQLDISDTSAKFNAGQLTRTKVATDASGGSKITLSDNRERAFPREGDWLSPQVETEMPFTELLPSWNATTPEQTGVRFDVRVRDAVTGAWTDWLYIGSWGRTLVDLHRITESGPAHVRIDELRSSKPANAYQIRARLYSFTFDESVVPTIRRVSVCASGPQGSVVAKRDDSMRIAAMAAGNDWRRNLDVPYRAQGDSPRPLQPQICSPTSTSMVLQYWGIDRPTLENAMAIYDGEYDMFGNWNRAVQRCGELGANGWLTRFRNWDEVHPYIAAGVPVIASIRFNAGEFPSSLLKASNGHLIVIRGFNNDGDVIVNDPGHRDGGDGAVYKADELAHAWFDKGGAGYVILKPD